jgi:hypothetical protein
MIRIRDKDWRLIEEDGIVTLLCPNALDIYVTGQKIHRLVAPKVEEVCCPRNCLIEIDCPVAKRISCNKNKIERINCPKVNTLICEKNRLTEIIAPKAISIHCRYNPDLTFIHAPRLNLLSYDGKLETEIPMDLINPMIHTGYYNTTTDYQSIVSQLMSLKGGQVKSARKV